jgi:hypothetical protein
MVKKLPRMHAEIPFDISVASVAGAPHSDVHTWQHKKLHRTQWICSLKCVLCNRLQVTALCGLLFSIVDCNFAVNSMDGT